jgi:hypothetical protein
MLDHSCQVQRHTHAERGWDLYETPAVATQALLRVETLPKLVWEPAAGRGAISRVLRNAGYLVIEQDLVDYVGRDLGVETDVDFLKQTRM